MKRGCLRILLVLAAATALWVSYLAPRVSDGEDLAGLAILGGFLTSAAVWAVWKTRAFRKDACAIERAGTGKAPVDGEWYAAAGEIHLLPGASLAAPFSGRPTVAYEYEVTRWTTTPGSDGRKTQSRAYYGSALTPCEIRTPAGPVHLLGMPYLDVEATTVGDPDSRRRAEAWAASTPFEATGIPHSLQELKADMDELIEAASPVGTFRRDYRGSPEPTLEGWTLSEKVVSPGQKVCVLGRYSAARRALEPPPVEAAEMLSLKPGDAPGALETAAGRAGCLRFVTAILVVLQAALLWFVPARREASESASTVWTPTESDLFRMASEGDADHVRLILEKKTVGPSPRDTIGRTPAHVAANAATLKVLLDAGAPPGVGDEFGLTPLMLAASEGDASKVQLLLERGAAVDARSRQGLTALSLASDPAARSLLERAGAPATGPWDGVGSPLPDSEDQWEVVLAYVDAVEEEDEPAYRALLAGDPGRHPTTVAVKGSTPGDLRFLTGHLAEGNAVVTGIGRGLDGGVLTTVTLENGGRSWKIRGVETIPMSQRRNAARGSGAE